MNCVQRYTNERRRRMKNAIHLFRITLIAVFAILFFSGSAMAFSEYLTSFNNLYKPDSVGSSSRTNASCDLCQSSFLKKDLNLFWLTENVRRDTKTYDSNYFPDLFRDQMGKNYLRFSPPTGRSFALSP